MFNQSKTEQIKDQLQEGVDVVTDKANEAAKEVAKTAENVGDNVQEAFGMSVDEVKGLMDKFKKFMDDQADELSAVDTSDVKKSFAQHCQDLKCATQDKAAAALKQGQKVVEEKPLGSMAAVAGLAALLGYVLAKKNTRF